MLGNTAYLNISRLKTAAEQSHPYQLSDSSSRV